MDNTRCRAPNVIKPPGSYAWLAGEAEIPPKAAAWIETLAAYHEAAEDLKRERGPTPLTLKGRAYAQLQSPVTPEG